ncbi:unnamed protein product, partial [marine sediment metagenome]
YDGRDHWLADGFHRLEAYVKAGIYEIEAISTKGTARDAMLLGITGANNTHGARFTFEDREANAQRLLGDPEWGKWSDREIGRRCHISYRTVGKLRGESKTAVRLYQRHGKVVEYRTGPSAKITKKAIKLLSHSKVAESEAERRKLAKLPPEQQAEVAEMLVAGDAKNVGDARRRMALCDLEEGLKDYDYSEKPVDHTPMVERHCRQIGAGQYRVRFTMDELGKERTLELLAHRGTFTPAHVPNALPAPETAVMFRQLLREGWERDVRVQLGEMTPQDAVVDCVDKRGYRKGWTDEEFLARQLVKLLEELGELAECMILPQNVRNLLLPAAAEAKTLFDNKEIWKGSKWRSDGDKLNAVKEIADMQVVLFCAADAMQVDSSAQAASKAKKDVERGTRK